MTKGTMMQMTSEDLIKAYQNEQKSIAVQTSIPAIQETLRIMNTICEVLKERERYEI